MVVEYLVSNALRHGRAAVRVSVLAHDVGWLTAVSDAATDRPPVPALDRDPAYGGMGLSLVARLGRVHGWAVDGDRKVVWARGPYLERTRRVAPTSPAGAGTRRPVSAPVPGARAGRS
jgi:hypothetical protein